MKYDADKLFGAKRRVWEADFLRGVAILLMCFDHFMYDLSILPSFFSDFYANAPASLYKMWDDGYNFYMSTFRDTFHYIFATLFLLISGISSTFSRNDGARCAKLFIFAAILSTATACIDSVADMGALIVFGIIHLLAFASLAYRLINKFLKNDFWFLAFGAAFIIGGIAIEWYAQPFVDMPKDTGQVWITVLEAMIGLTRVGSDHFPLFPCAGVVLWGAYIGKKFYPERKSLLPMLDGAWNKGFCAIGRNTLWVYLLHQPVVAGIIMIIGMTNGLSVF